MKNFVFRLEGINNTVLGRVSAILLDDCKGFTFVGGQLEGLFNRRSSGELSIYQVPFGMLPTINSDGTKFELNLGDVVLFHPTGKCTILYESQSSSNCIMLTERCNSNCIMCVQPPRACSDNTNLASALIGLIYSPPESIGITGGEPTLAWDGLLHLVRLCRERLPTTEIQLLSNARVLKSIEKSKELADAGGEHLMVCVPLYSEISQIHDTIVGIKGAFWEAVEGIYNLERNKVPVEIRTVIQKLNFQRLPQWSEFIYRLFPFVSHVALMAIEPIGLALKNSNDVWIDPLDYMSFLELAIKTLHRGDLKVSIYNHQLCTLPRHLWRFSKQSISEWKNVFFNNCYECTQRPNCAGLFEASKNKMSRGINAIH